MEALTNTEEIIQRGAEASPPALFFFFGWGGDQKYVSLITPEPFF